MRITRRFAIWAAALVIIAGVATAAMWPKPDAVDVARVARGPLRVTIDAEARTRARTRFSVTAPVTGRVHRLTRRSGDLVRPGEVIAVIAPSPLDAATLEAVRSRLTTALAAQRDAEARIRQAREASAIASRMVTRYRALEEAGGISRQQCEEVELTALLRAEDLLAVEARWRAATAEVHAARAALPHEDTAGRSADVLVRAPIAGRVLDVPEASERVVAAGTPLLSLARDADLEVVADVLSEDAIRIVVGAIVELRHWGGDALLPGTVASIEPAAHTRVSALGVDEQRVNVIITPARAPRGLGDGFRLDARIVVWEGRDVVAAPASAVVAHGNESRVFVVVDGRARERTVRTGRQSETRVEVLAGLREGEDVILFPSDRIRSGMRVRGRAVTVAEE